MLRPFVAVHSCVKFAMTGVHQAIRDTWGRGCPWPLFLFVGRPGEVPLEPLTDRFLDDCKKHGFIDERGRRFHGFFSREEMGRPLLPDEVEVGCCDAYIALPWKKKEITRFQLERGYTHCLQFVADSYVLDWEGIRGSGFEGHQYAGTCNPGDEAIWGAHGYWLTAAAAGLLLDAPMDLWAEDWWVGDIMRRNGINYHRITGMGAWVAELSHLGHGKGLDPERVLGFRRGKDGSMA